MANWAIRCDEPSEVIDQAGALLAALSDAKVQVDDLNKQLSEHVGNLGEVNDNLVNAMISIGGTAFQTSIDSIMVVVTDSILYPAFDAYVMKYGYKHEKDNRADA